MRLRVAFGCPKSSHFRRGRLNVLYPLKDVRIFLGTNVRVFSITVCWNGGSVGSTHGRRSVPSCKFLMKAFGGFSPPGIRLHVVGEGYEYSTKHGISLHLDLLLVPVSSKYVSGTRTTIQMGSQGSLQGFVLFGTECLRQGRRNR
jgi:hypothetical protein